MECMACICLSFAQSFSQSWGLSSGTSWEGKSQHQYWLFLVESLATLVLHCISGSHQKYCNQNRKKNLCYIYRFVNFVKNIFRNPATSSASGSRYQFGQLCWNWNRAYYVQDQFPRRLKGPRPQNKRSEKIRSTTVTPFHLLQRTHKNNMTLWTNSKPSNTTENQC